MILVNILFILFIVHLYGKYKVQYILLATCALMLGRYGDISVLKLQLFDVTLIELVIISYSLMLIIVLIKKINRISIYYQLLLFTTISISCINLITSDDKLSFIYNLLLFISPIIIGVRVSLLDSLEKDKLLDFCTNMAFIIATISLSSLLASSILSNVLGWDTTFERSLSPIGGSIASGALLILFWPIIIHSFVHRFSVYNLIRFVVYLSSILFTGSRLIIFTSIVLLLIVFLLTGRFRLFEIIKKTSVVLIILIVASYIFYSLSDLAAFRRILDFDKEKAGDVSRIVSVSTGLTLISENPFFGHGSGQTYDWYKKTIDLSESNIQYINGKPSLVEPHNIYIMLAVDYGIMILFMFILFNYRVLKINFIKKNIQYRLAALGVLGFYIQAFGSSHLLINIKVSIFFWVLIGILLTKIEKNK